jgi:prepilin-type N-terminal cleavage/methylation domain-containing protein
MRVRSQSGMTLVELLIAMAVTTMVLVGATGVLFRVSDRFQAWEDRIADASAGAAMAAAIQNDSHRYVVCHPTDHVPELDFCIPSTTSQVVTYQVVGTSPPYSILRTENGRSVLVARAMHGRPVFWSECRVGPGTISGHIHVYQYRDVGGSENFSVYYRAPLPYGGAPC